ncbi:MAG: TIGR01212 family radical SAM protein [Clostridia bacterium]|nr:TIGR01212 family radical SAM protein [Clostridia bacterium]
MKKTQRSENPYRNTDSNKRYFTYDYYLRKKFGAKLVRIPLDIGLTCPNIDGRCGVGGCIYCSSRGSGDFAESSALSVREQILRGRERLSSKWNTERCIAYFQAHTNTYAPLDFLRARFEEALACDGVEAISIATRADCLEQHVCEYLGLLAERIPLTVELGLQSSSDATAERINRGHSFAEFCEGYSRLRSASDKIELGVHIILGLPGESREDMLRTVADVAKLSPDQVKIHLLHVLCNTKLAELYESGEYTPLGKEEYVSLAVDALELLPPDTVIARITGDAPQDELLAPEWSRKKVSVINDIDKLLYQRGSYQGIRFLG